MLRHGSAGALDGIADLLPLASTLPPSATYQLIEAIDRVDEGDQGTAAFHDLIEAWAELYGKKDGELYTPRSVTHILTSVLSLESASTVYDPACRFGELLVAATEGRTDTEQNISVYGTALSTETLHIARMHTALTGIPSNIQPSGPVDSSRKHTFPPDPSDMPQRFSRIITNPPFGRKRSTDIPEPTRYTHPTKGRADYLWIAEAIRSLEPEGLGAVVMPNGTLFSSNSYDSATRREILEDGCIEAIITLPPSLFYSTAVPVCVWLLRSPTRARDDVLLIDASTKGTPATRARQEIRPSGITWVSDIVKTWRERREVALGPHAVAVPQAVVREREYNLSPSIYLEKTPPAGEEAPTRSRLTEMVDNLARLRRAADEADAAADRELRGIQW